jgi:starch phosphorylase
MDPSRYLPRVLPEPLEGLATLALDLLWSWNDGASVLWAELDPQLWQALENPWLILESVSQERLERLSQDAGFLGRLQRHLETREAYLRRATWWSGLPAAASAGRVAFFSMEYGLSEALPIYSGGLGILAGDYLKTASDLGVPVVGVGLLYQLGYFRQALDRRGEQLAFFPYNDPTMLPAVPLRDARGEWLHVTVELPGRSLRLRSWKVEVGRVSLYLLDTNDPLNSPGDRGITGELYGGDRELRLQQELALGIGGWRLLDALGVSCDVLHLNEGHTAFAVLERARSFMKGTGLSFPVALRCLRAGNLFTTHTAVAAGFDRFRPDLVAQYLRDYAADLGIETRELLALGRERPDDDSEPFNMAYLAMRGCGQVNAVSRVHEAVSQGIFQPLFPRWPQGEVPVGHVTNGVHVPSWDSAAADAIWSRSCGESRWLGDLSAMEERFRCLPDEELWRMRSEGRRALVEFVRARAARQHAAREPSSAQLLLDPDALTLGFARRFATYKRPNLLLHDRARLTRLLTAPHRPVQLIIAGKAHPDDEGGKRLVREWTEYLRTPDVAGRAVFLEDYDMALATELVQGVDLWVNTPRRPWEACGTSGMKVLVNGGLNLSELDGWWAEAYAPEVGWAIGDLKEHGDDPAYDAWEADALYGLLEREVVPSFYERDGRGVPAEWVARMRESMALLTPRFSANRMLREYVERYYLPAAARCRERCGDRGRLGLELERWERRLAEAWRELRFGALTVDRAGEDFVFEVELLLGSMDPEAIRVELYADPAGDRGPERHPLQVAREIPGGRSYRGRAPAARPQADYTPRVVPGNPRALAAEVSRILWYR